MDDIRDRIRRNYLGDETETVRGLAASVGLTVEARSEIADAAAELVRRVRATSQPNIMESFLAEYGLSTKEGVALMCLAEALLRVPDEETIDALIADKIAPSNWGAHLGHSSSSLVNASTWALMLTGRVVAHDEPQDEEGLAAALHGVVRRLGEPVVRTAVGQAMRELGRNFVLGRDIGEALQRAQELEANGYTYSYDMLGEAARTEADARAYHLDYSEAISAIAKACSGDVRANPSVSVKLSALHPRYEFGQRRRVMTELVARTRALALLAHSANIGFNIDAEEADRLDLSLDVIEAVLSDPALAGWDGFGVVVQTYGPRAAHVVDWLHALAEKLDRRIMVRLVKGAYWDTEIKRAQVMGLDGYPVFTRKTNTDVSYMACARKLLGMSNRIYPQFATHNAHTVAAVRHMARAAGVGKEAFEFQRLHGMGESLHDAVLGTEGTRCRIYAPVGAHRDLLAYLVRRLLENGANSSFVNQIVDESVPATEIARDPLAVVEELDEALPNPGIPAPVDLFGADRRNARGWDITDPLTVAAIDEARTAFLTHQWHVGPMIAGDAPEAGPRRTVTNPADADDTVGQVEEATEAHVSAALAAAETGFADWSERPVDDRATCLERLADLYEAEAPEFFALATREAGKSLLDGVAEVREAVDFLRFYAAEARRIDAEGGTAARGTIVCISPWNFPLAIFTGQIAAALAAGNTVIAKPAEQSPLIAAKAVALMHAAGIPEAAIQLLPGDGPTVGGPLCSDPGIAGVCFTGSTEVAQIINRAMARNAAPDAPLIAETGGLNAMIVDSTALPEQAVRDVIASAFQSAGQRCSALRVLYVQKDVENRLLEMLTGAMDALTVGNPWNLETDVGPVIDAEAQSTIEAHCSKMEAEGRLIHKLPLAADLSEGRFVAPVAYRIDGIGNLAHEVFGPVLHVASFEAGEIEDLLGRINARGYGLTFGLHTRVDERVQRVVDGAEVGNLYVNRNQIGAVVGSQPFGGEGLSGTGPKAGGPHYLRRFRRALSEPPSSTKPHGDPVPIDNVSRAIAGLDLAPWAAREDRGRRLATLLEQQTGPVYDALVVARRLPAAPLDLPGPTGESNRLSLHARGVFVCLGDGSAESALAQAVQVLALGGGAVVVTADAEATVAPLAEAGLPIHGVSGTLDPADVGRLAGIAGIAALGDAKVIRPYRIALADRDGPILPLITDPISPIAYAHERALCVDTTAAGGNASLLAASA